MPADITGQHIPHHVNAHLAAMFSYLPRRRVRGHMRHRCTTYSSILISQNSFIEFWLGKALQLPSGGSVGPSLHIPTSSRGALHYALLGDNHDANIIYTCIPCAFYILFLLYCSWHHNVHITYTNYYPTLICLLLISHPLSRTVSFKRA